MPQDLIIHQELIFQSKPDYFIEVGVAWSGSLLYYSSIFNIIGGKKVIGIDTYVPNEIVKKKKISKIKKQNRTNKRIFNRSEGFKKNKI